MGGWIKIDKDLTGSMRFRRLVKRYRSNASRGVTDDNVTNDVTLCLGGLVQLWLYADTHITDGNVLAMNIDEIDELVGIEGFGAALPEDWLKVLDADHVELPDFLEHNKTSAKERSDAARRQAEYRWRKKNGKVTRDVMQRNTRDDARPDQTRPDQTKNSSPISVGNLLPSESSNSVTRDATPPRTDGEKPDEIESVSQARAQLRAVVAKLTVSG